MERIAIATAPASGGARRNAQRARLWLFAGAAAAIVIADQLSKAIIRSWLPERRAWPTDFDLIRFQHVENSGAAFGILQDAGPFLIVSSLIGVAAVLLFLRSTPAEDRLHSAALALVLGGAIGNLTDRIVYGAVIDFLDFRLWGGYVWPTFNMADSWIVCGVAILMLGVFFEADPEPEPPVAAEEGGE